MKLSADSVSASPKGWIQSVLENFDAFLQDHANCERHSSQMAMELVGKYPEKTDIVPALIETAIEELEHFQRVYCIMEKRGLSLLPQDGPGAYLSELYSHCRPERDARFVDELLLASILECRGAERFRTIHQHLPAGKLKEFYQQLAASESKHAHLYVKMSAQYLPQTEVQSRLHQLIQQEAAIMDSMEVRPALH
ncbi:tRNA isopentenyl-2-thiomethyl-A-37 hydroxylase MiaE [Pontibacter sp. G13]|uniref:tRNA isopentenyl-2-thiomethyl-A-37 hydroxylase MiaE n=1 Tax=Pontibacter sp. G13 TaxID=3074898 RepID=UPI00288A3D0A|nr:tRNA isopentenyl-2-thiomethyl-A-37 hydroxylase MiaE [Pontibacter sp. G13]WNJ16338.1 tRNA isopentenyl-2-thiomethyl-A-37 hydroxylase MiaE [Pontibacter sp. G13]